MSLESSDVNSLLNGSLLPDDIFVRIDDDFFSIVKLVTGESVFKILQVQLINSARKLLNTGDVFAFFQIESDETDAIKAASCCRSKTGQYIVKPGIQTALSNLIKLLQQKLNQEELLLDNDDEPRNIHITDEFLDKHPLLKSLIKWYQQNGSDKSNKANTFLSLFIDNLTVNLKQSSNNFRYTEPVKKFAMCLYILGGRQCYEFVRLNLLGALPSLTTLTDMINQSNLTLTEAQFRFESLQQAHSRFAFCSEDTTGVIRPITVPAHKFSSFSQKNWSSFLSIGADLFEQFDSWELIFSKTSLKRLLLTNFFSNIGNYIQ